MPKTKTILAFFANNNNIFQTASVSYYNYIISTTPQYLDKHFFEHEVLLIRYTRSTLQIR